MVISSSVSVACPNGTHFAHPDQLHVESEESCALL
jgi:hypothetical protein